MAFVHTLSPSGEIKSFMETWSQALNMDSILRCREYSRQREHPEEMQRMKILKGIHGYSDKEFHSANRQKEVGRVFS